MCCKEIVKVVEKMNDLKKPVCCITEHAGFEAVCLNEWVLQTAYYQYRQQYGSDAHPTPTLHKYVKASVVLSFNLSLFYRKYRYTSYRQLTRWCWGWLGKDIRVVLPSCAVVKIREKFPSESYGGFKYPTIL